MATKTPQQIYHEFISSLRGGNSIEVACVYSGLTMTQLRLMRQDPEIDEEIRRAAVEAEMSLVSSLVKAGLEGNTDAARWYLERKGEQYMTVAQRKEANLKSERWQLEKRIVEAELEADPANAVALLTEVKKPKMGRKPKPVQAEVIDVERLPDI